MEPPSGASIDVPAYFLQLARSIPEGAMYLSSVFDSLQPRVLVFDDSS